MQINNPSSAAPSLILRATLLADFTTPFAAPMDVIWTAGGFTVGQPTRLTVPAGYTRAIARLSLNGNTSAVNGAFNFAITLNGNAASPSTARRGVSQMSTNAGAFGGYACQVFTGKMAVVAGDYFTARFNYIGTVPTSITAQESTFFEIELS